jgi:hypothetical protein
MRAIGAAVKIALAFAVALKPCFAAEVTPNAKIEKEVNIEDEIAQRAFMHHQGAIFDELIKILASVKDEESARAAVARLRSLERSADSLIEWSKLLETTTPSVDEQTIAEYTAKHHKTFKLLSSQIHHLGSNPELGKIVFAPVQRISVKMVRAVPFPQGR